MSWQTRIDLARRGWHTEMRFSRDGIGPANDTTFSCGVWARRHYWNGWIADICLHAHAIFDCAQPDAAERAAAVIEDVAEVCTRAETDYPDQIVCQTLGRDAEGRIKIAVNDWEMKQVDRNRPKLYPTEAIPPALDICAPGEGHIEQMLAALQDGLEIEDSINSYFGHARFARDCKDRQWGYRLRIAKRRAADGARITYRPQVFTSESLHETLAASLIEGARFGMTRLFNRYATGGDLAGTTANGLPPSATTLAEYRQAQEAAKSAAYADDEDDA